MPRTKQQKPRHIVERENANGASPMPETFSESGDDVMDDEQEEAITYPTPHRKKSPDPDFQSGKDFAKRHLAEEFNEGEAYAPAQLMDAEEDRDMPSVPENDIPPSNGVSSPESHKMDARHEVVLHRSISKRDKADTRTEEIDNVETNFLKSMKRSESDAGENVEHSTHNSSNHSDAQYKVLSAAAAHYMNTIKMLLGNNKGAGADSNAPLGDVWSAWANAARRCTLPEAPNAQNDPMVHAYMAQLSDRWNSIMGQQVAKATGPNSPVSTQHRDPTVHSPKPSGGLHPRTPNGVASFQPPASDSPLSRGRLGASQPQTMAGDSQNEPIRMGAEQTNAVDKCPPLHIANATSKGTNSETSYGPQSAPITNSDQSCWQKSITPYQTPRSLSSSNALGYHSPSTPSLSNAFRFPSPRREHTATTQGPQKIFENKCDDSSKQVTVSHKKQGSFSSVSSSSHDGSYATSDKTSPTVSASDRSPRHTSDVSPRAKATGEYAYFPEVLDELRNHGMPYASFPPSWMGMPLPGGVLSPPFGNLSPGGVPHSQSQLLFPTRLPLVPGTISTSRQLSPHLGGVSSNSPFLDSFPSSSVKGSAPRRRTRGPPIDSVHAAIVREAKEQFKGLDPENMYIQCPICQKRIKRLYHFQRHMRIHTGEKTHHCPCCQYKSVRKDNLKSHMKTHEKQNIENSRRAGRSAFQGPRNDADALCRNRGPASLPSVSKSANEPSGVLQLNSIVEKPPRREPPLKAASDYKATFASSYAPPYPFPYFPHPYHHPYINTSPNYQGMPSENTRAGRKHHSLPTTPEANRNSSPGLDCKGMSSSATASPAGFNSTDLVLSKPVSPNSLKRSIDEQQAENTPPKPSLPPIEAKRQKLLPSDEILPSVNSNSNQNNSNPVKNDRIFRAWGSDETPRNGRFRNSTSSESSVVPSQNQDALLGLARFDLSTVDLPKYPFYAESNMFFRGDSRKGIEGVADEQRSKSSISSSSSISSAFSPSSENRSREGTPKMRATSVIKSPPRSGADSDPARNSHAFGDNERRAVGERLGGVQVKVEASQSSPGSESVPDGMKSEESKSPPADGTGINKELSCRLCTFRATSSNGLQTHMTLTHKQDGFYKCDVCNYLGKNLSKLVEHIRIHTGERPFKCDQCNYAAKRKDNLAQHKAVRHDKRKAKGGGLYTVLDQISQQREINGTATTRVDVIGCNSPIKKGGFVSKPPHMFNGDFSHNKTDPMAAFNDAERMASGGIPIAPLFHSFPPVHSIPPYLYPFCFPSPLVPGAELGGAVNGPPHAHSVNDRPTNPGSYSLKAHLQPHANQIPSRSGSGFSA